MKTLTMVGYEFRRVFRYRMNIFFLFLFPLLMILVLGVAFGGSQTPKVGVVSVRPGPLGAGQGGLAGVRGGAPPRPRASAPAK